VAAPRCVIGLGANLGDRLATFEAALGELAELGTISAVSQLYETIPVGGPVQPDYYNAAVCIRSQLEPRALLQRLLEIERNHGRIRDCRWGPRRLDLDILWIEGAAIDEPGLKVPHARLLERNFALRPLVEVAPDATDPTTGTPYRQCANSQRSEGMRRCSW
jgi:2-amino-4-hydroxy-6-hydroxymethyldihydropteridine diphosphokinase